MASPYQERPLSYTLGHMHLVTYKLYTAPGPTALPKPLDPKALRDFSGFDKVMGSILHTLGDPPLGV